MHIQPLSNQIRKYIPREAYFELMHQQRIRSLIGLPLNRVDKGLREKRTFELEELEQAGFVYVGEKNWLLSYEQEESPDFQNYEQWVLQNFSSFLGLEFTISTEFAHLDYIIWKAEFDATNLALGYDALKNPGYLAIDELEILIGGNEHSLSPAHVMKAFEFLHNLEYAISTIPSESTITRELSVTGIDVSNPADPCRWELEVVSEYGGDLEKTIINGISWRSI